MRSEKSCITMLFFALSLAALLNGCGSSSKEGSGSPATVARVSETACAQCHGSSVSSVTGQPLYASYAKSAHFDNNVGCQDCHGGGAQHNGVGPLPYANPDQADRCRVCHTTTESLVDDNGVQILTKKHFGIDATGSLVGPFDGDVAAYASYVTESSKNNCRLCHDPHAAVTPQHSQWAETGHAALDKALFRQFDFGNGVKGGCGLKCHTTTGFKSFIANQSAALVPFKTNPNDKTMEVIRCDACHRDYSWALNKVNGGAVALPYPAYTADTAVPASGDSNLCIGCHIGLLSGKQIVSAASVDGVKFEAFSPHYKTSAAVLYGLNGYEFPEKNHSDYVPGFFEHNKPGTDAAFGFGTKNGACVVCHMWVDAANQKNHGMEPVAYTGMGTVAGREKIDATISKISASAVCAACHTGGYALTAASLDAEKKQFKAELDALIAAFDARGISFDAIDGPHYFSDNTADKAYSGVVNGAKSKYAILWSSVAPDGNGKKMAGAAFNLLMLIKDSGAYVHNSRYAKTLLYDSLDYVVNGNLTGNLGVQGATLTVGATGKTVTNPFNGASRP